MSVDAEELIGFYASLYRTITCEASTSDYSSYQNSPVIQESAASVKSDSRKLILRQLVGPDTPAHRLFLDRFHGTGDPLDATTVLLHLAILFMTQQPSTVTELDEYFVNNWHDRIGDGCWELLVWGMMADVSQIF